MNDTNSDPTRMSIEEQKAAQAVAWYVFADDEHWVTLDREEAQDNEENGLHVRPLQFADMSRPPGYTHEDVMRLVEAGKKVIAECDVAGGDDTPADMVLRTALAPFTHQAKDGSR